MNKRNFTLGNIDDLFNHEGDFLRETANIYNEGVVSHTSIPNVSGAIFVTLLIHCTLFYLLLATVNAPKDYRYQVKNQAVAIKAKLIYKTASKTKKVESTYKNAKPEVNVKANSQVVPQVSDNATVFNKDKFATRKIHLSTIKDSVSIEPILADENRAKDSAAASAKKSSIAHSALKQLRDSVYDKELNTGAVEYYNKVVKVQETVDKSMTKFLPQGQVAPVKIKVKRVDCKNKLHKSISTLSGLFGGHITCHSGPDLEGFIKQRINKN